MIYVLAGFITYQPSMTRPLNPQTHTPGGSRSVFVPAAAQAQRINFNKEPLLFFLTVSAPAAIHSPAVLRRQTRGGTLDILRVLRLLALLVALAAV